MFNIYQRIQAKVVADHILPRFNRRVNRRAPKKAPELDATPSNSEQQRLSNSRHESQVHSPLKFDAPGSLLESEYSPVTELDLDGSAETIDALFLETSDAASIQSAPSDIARQGSHTEPLTSSLVDIPAKQEEGVREGAKDIPHECMVPDGIDTDDDHFDGLPEGHGTEDSSCDISDPEDAEFDDVVVESNDSQEYRSQAGACAQNTPCEPFDGDDQDMTEEQAEIEAVGVFTSIQLDPEDYDDYTAGPSRLSLAHDGMKESAAVLLTWELSQNIKQAAMLQRSYDEESKYTQAQLDEISDFKMKINREIRKHELKASDQQFSNTGDNGEAVQGEPAATENELDCLKGMLANMDARKTQVENALSSTIEYLREAQALVIAKFDEAFVHGLLLPGYEPVEKTVEVFDLQAEYKKYKTALAEDKIEMDVPVPELDTSDDHLYNTYVPSAEERRVSELLTALWEAQERFGAADLAFDLRVETQRQESEYNRQAWHCGQPAYDATQEDFDKRWFVRVQELTRELAAAEDTLERAMIACADAKIEINDKHQLDHWPQYSEDGDRGSEVDWTDEDFALRTLHCKDDDGVNQWLDDVPDVLKKELPLPVVELDSWSCKEHSNEDSWSSHGIGRDRRKIDKSTVDRLAMVGEAMRDYCERQPACQDDVSRRIDVELIAQGRPAEASSESSRMRRSSWS